MGSAVVVWDFSDKVVLMPHSYTQDFDTKFEILGDGQVLYSANLTPGTLPTAELNINLGNVKILKISFQDNKPAGGGSPFGLADFCLLN